MNAWTMSKALGCRPSEVFGIQRPLTAYCFDSAVTRWGMALQEDLQRAADDAKDRNTSERAQARVLRKYVPSTARFRDPAKE